MRLSGPRVSSCLEQCYRPEAPVNWRALRCATVIPGGLKLAICDGPPGSTKGGRYGFMPNFNDRLAPDAVILLDDADRSGEQKVLQRWQEEFGWKTEMRGQEKPFAVVTR